MGRRCAGPTLRATTCQIIGATSWPVERTSLRVSLTNDDRFSRRTSVENVSTKLLKRYVPIILFKSSRLCCFPITGTRCGLCREATIATRCVGCESKKSSRSAGWKQAEQKLLSRSPVRSIGNEVFGKGDTGNIPFVTKPTSSGASTTRIGIRASTSWPHECVTGNGRPFIGWCVKASTTLIGAAPIQHPAGTIPNGANNVGWDKHSAGPPTTKQARKNQS